MPDPRSTSHGGEGPRFGDYGRLFPGLRPLAVPDSVFLSLGAPDGPMVDPESNVQTWNSQTPPDDGGNNTSIPAGYTYLGQFIDHDLTLDFTSDPNQRNKAEDISNARTPAFDLDSVYGLGPEVHPHLYEADNTLSLSTADDGKADLLRLSEADGRAVAIIGDPRNDENLLVSQVQLALISLHNRFMQDLAQEALSEDPNLPNRPIWEQRQKQKESFDKAMELTRWHYQWVVLNDFLRRTVGEEIVNDVVENGPVFYKDEKLNSLPIEFSGAVYRFGHTQVRPDYLVRDNVLLPVFKDDGNDLRGSTKLTSEKRVDWRRFFDFNGSNPQPTRRIDTKISAALFRMFPGKPGEGSDVPPTDRLLAFRNLRRGVALGLPSGEAVAKHMQEELTRQGRPDFGISTLEDAEDTKLGGATYRSIRGPGGTPLWYWILSEASASKEGTQLGPVGGRIVAEVFIGLLENDSRSFLSKKPGWEPREDLKINSKFDVSALLTAARVA